MSRLSSERLGNLPKATQLQSIEIETPLALEPKPFLLATPPIWNSIPPNRWGAQKAELDVGCGVVFTEDLAKPSSFWTLSRNIASFEC